MEKQIVKVKLSDGYAQMPKYAHDGDLGLDVTAVKITYDYDNDNYIYHTGICMETDKNLGAFVMLRSSNKRTECYLTNGVGLVETFLYRGEICLSFKNRDSITTMASYYANCVWNTRPFYVKIANFFGIGDDYEKILWETEDKFRESALKYAPYRVGERIGQLVFLNFPEVELVQVDKLSETERGTGGFGSTGK